MGRRRKQKTASESIFGTSKERAERASRERARQRRARAEARMQEAERRRHRASLRRAAAAANRESEAKKKKRAERLTARAERKLKAIENTLLHTLSVNDVVDWQSLADKLKRPIPKPDSYHPLDIPPAPDSSNPKYMPRVGFAALFSPKRRQRASGEALELFQRDMAEWQRLSDEIEAKNAALATDTTKQKIAYKADVDHRKQQFEALRRLVGAYREKDLEAVLYYCEIVLGNSEYPDSFPQLFEIDFQEDSKQLVVDYLLPGIEVIPTRERVRYVVSRDTFKESSLSQTEIRKTYDSLVYQIALRTIHELFEADTVNALKMVVFNGWVETVDKSTGHDSLACIASVSADKRKFTTLKLRSIDPQSCFESLDGVVGSRPYKHRSIDPDITTGRAELLEIGEPPSKESDPVQHAAGL